MTTPIFQPNFIEYVKFKKMRCLKKDLLKHSSLKKKPVKRHYKKGIFRWLLSSSNENII